MRRLRAKAARRPDQNSLNDNLRLSLRPALQHPHPLSDREPDARPPLDLSVKDLAHPVERVAGPQHALNTLVVLRPLLGLVEIAVIRDSAARQFLRRTNRPS
jgi:hypothetical protein